MRVKPFLLIVVLGIGFCFTKPASANTNPEALARLAVSENTSESLPAISTLREMGPAGLRVLFEVYRDEIERHAVDSSTPQASTPLWQRLAAALDAVSQQRDSYTSGLYWHTDIERAKEESRKSGKPILSLRLLGKLTDEYSCANSRFFRAALYSNRAVSAYLRDHFILHWKTVRAVPRVTVDYGDGRKLERTLTGNSIHYILDADGRPIDALPGLYGPAAFMRGLAQAEAVSKETAGQSLEKRADILRRYHQARIDAAAADWLADTKKVGGKIPSDIAARTSSNADPPSAAEAGARAATKAVTESSIINGITTDAVALTAVTDEETWNKIAALHDGDAKLDDNSIALIRRQTPLASETTVSADKSKRPSQDQLSRIVRKFERYMALDTVRNEYMLRSKLHAWLSLQPNRDVDSLNEKVYAELFLTPSSDPWLGLLSPDTYTALENGGIVN
ncbi:MAG: hypothetical protein WCF57_24670 [Pyrinomonadaceae bacterium]